MPQPKIVNKKTLCCDTGFYGSNRNNNSIGKKRNTVNQRSNT